MASPVCRFSFCAGALLSAFLVTSTAGAQTANEPPPSDQPQSQPGPQSQPPAASASALPLAPEAAPADPFKRIDDLSLKGWNIPFPRVADTILNDDLGIRDALADAGIGFFAFSLNQGVYNIRDDDYHGKRLYNGQKPTYSFGLQAIFLTYDLGHVGVDGGQIFFSGATTTNQLQSVNGVRDTRIANLGYFQSLFDGKVQLKIGFFDNSNEYVGPSVGGSVTAGALGPQARIPVQAGFGYSNIGTPALNVRLALSNTVYTKFGVQRSLPAGGGAEEIMRDGLGLRFSVPGAKALFVDETGYQTQAGPGQKSTWVRAGGIYNTTDYVDYRTGRARNNWAAYIVADRQLTQTDPNMPFRGLYGGLSFNYAPAHQNLFTQSFEGRLYAFGPFDGHPFDLLSVVATYNKLSKTVVDVIAAGQPANHDVASLTASYAYRFKPGVYVQPGVGLSRHTTITPKLPIGVNLYLGLNFLF